MGLGVAAGSGHSAAARRRCLKGSTTVVGNTRGVPMKKLRRSVLAIASLGALGLVLAGPGTATAGSHGSSGGSNGSSGGSHGGGFLRGHHGGGSSGGSNGSSGGGFLSKHHGGGSSGGSNGSSGGGSSTSTTAAAPAAARTAAAGVGSSASTTAAAQQRRLERQRRRLVLTFLRCRSWAPDMPVAGEEAGWSRPRPAPPVIRPAASPRPPGDLAVSVHAEPAPIADRPAPPLGRPGRSPWRWALNCWLVFHLAAIIIAPASVEPSSELIPLGMGPRASLSASSST